MHRQIALYSFANNCLKQAVARAVYSKKKFVVMDDVFSGLDNKTARAVFHGLLGSDGLLRNSGQTVVLATNNGEITLLSIGLCIY